MVVEQLADYSQLLDEVTCAILVPSKPCQDLFALASSAEWSWPDRMAQVPSRNVVGPLTCTNGGGAGRA
jgi:hypothetical protein